jgi:hypothetical protein
MSENLSPEDVKLVTLARAARARARAVEGAAVPSCGKHCNKPANQRY